MQNIWETFKNYYIGLGNSYHVDPGIFLGIHIVATPLFLLAIAWIIKNHRQKKSLLLPVIFSVIIFNAANIYLVTFGINIPWWVYTLLAVSTLISGYYSYKKITKKIKSS